MAKVFMICVEGRPFRKFKGTNVKMEKMYESHINLSLEEFVSQYPSCYVKSMDDVKFIIKNKDLNFHKGLYGDVLELAEELTEKMESSENKKDIMTEAQLKSVLLVYKYLGVRFEGSIHITNVKAFLTKYRKASFAASQQTPYSVRKK